MKNTVWVHSKIEFRMFRSFYCRFLSQLFMTTLPILTAMMKTLFSTMAPKQPMKDAKTMKQPAPITIPAARIKFWSYGVIRPWKSLNFSLATKKPPNPIKTKPMIWKCTIVELQIPYEIVKFAKFLCSDLHTTLGLRILSNKDVL